jgi:hypothetical protein
MYCMSFVVKLLLSLSSYVLLIVIVFTNQIFSGLTVTSGTMSASPRAAHASQQQQQQLQQQQLINQAQARYYQQ